MNEQVKENYQPVVDPMFPSNLRHVYLHDDHALNPVCRFVDPVYMIEGQ